MSGTSRCYRYVYMRSVHRQEQDKCGCSISNSSCVVQVLGNALGVFGTGFSILIFRNPVTAAGLLGYSVTMAGVALFVVENQKGSPAGIGQPAGDAERHLLLRKGQAARTAGPDAGLAAVHGRASSHMQRQSI